MLEEIFPVYIAHLDIPASDMCARLSAVCVQLVRINASMNRRVLDWRNCTFIQILCIYLKRRITVF